VPRYYADYAGNPDGTPEDPNRCAVEVYTGRSPIGTQCPHPRGHGPDGILCAAHHRALKAGRDLHIPADEPRRRRVTVADRYGRDITIRWHNGCADFTVASRSLPPTIDEAVRVLTSEIDRLAERHASLADLRDALVHAHPETDEKAPPPIVDEEAP
jgi:hypothetical protein